MPPNAAYDKRPFDFGTRNPAADTALERAAEPFAAKFRGAFRTRAARSYHTLPFRAVRPSFGAAYGMRFGRQEHGSTAGRHRPDSARGLRPQRLADRMPCAEMLHSVSVHAIRAPRLLASC